MVILTMGARVVIDTLYTCNSAKNEAIGTRMTYQHVQGEDVFLGKAASRAEVAKMVLVIKSFL